MSDHKHEHQEMMPKEKEPGKMYQLFKVHKAHDPPNLLSGIPVISGCGSITENLSKFVDHHAKHLVTEIPLFLQDTPDLLSQLEDLKRSFPVSIDEVGLYINIPHEREIKFIKNALEKEQTKQYQQIY
jgi:hypothetical protein